MQPVQPTSVHNFCSFIYHSTCTSLIFPVPFNLYIKQLYILYFHSCTIQSVDTISVHTFFSFMYHLTCTNYICTYFLFIHVPFNLYKLYMYILYFQSCTIQPVQTISVHTFFSFMYHSTCTNDICTYFLFIPVPFNLYKRYLYILSFLHHSYLYI